MNPNTQNEKNALHANTVALTTMFAFSQETIDVDLHRPEHGGFGLLIARDKNLPPPALFVNEVTPGGIAAKTGLMEKGERD